MANFSVYVSPADIANEMRDNGYSLAEVLNELGGRKAAFDEDWFEEIREDLDDDGARMLAALAKHVAAKGPK